MAHHQHSYHHSFSPLLMFANMILLLIVGIPISLPFWIETFLPAFDDMPIRVVTGDENELLKNVEDEFKKITSKDDKILIYKLFAGSAKYLKNCKSLNETRQFDPMLGKVQSSYGWDREKYKTFTDAVSAYLISVDYDTPKKLETEQQRKDFAQIFDNLAKVTKYE